MHLHLNRFSVTDRTGKERQAGKVRGTIRFFMLLAGLLTILALVPQAMAAGENGECSVSGTVELPVFPVSHDQLVLEFYDAAGDGTTPLVTQQVSTTGVSFLAENILAADTTYKIRCSNPPGSTAPFVPAWHEKVASFEAATAVTCEPFQDISGITFSLVAPKYGISGKITLNDAGLAGVSVTLTGNDFTPQTVATDANGDYAFTDLFAGDYTITPEKDYLIFAPAGLNVTVSDGDLTTEDFIVEPIYQLSGQVTEKGVDAPGVTVLLTGTTSDNRQIDPPLAVITANDGSYLFTSISTGDYIITPQKGIKVFEPESLAQQVIDSDITSQDFAIVPPTINFAGNLVFTGDSGEIMCTDPAATAYENSTETDGQYTTGGTSTSEKTYNLAPTDSVTLDLEGFSLGYFEQVTDLAGACIGDRRIYVNGQGTVRVNNTAQMIARDISLNMAIDYQNGITGSGIAVLDMDTPSVSFLREEFDTGSEQVEFIFSSFSPVRQDEFGVYAFDLTLQPAETPAPFVFFKNRPYTVAESDIELTVTVGISGPSAEVVALDYSTSDATAVAGSDYTATTGTLTWAAGETTDRTFTIPVTRDSAVEGDESFQVNLANSANAIIISTTTTVTISNTCNGEYSTGDSDGDGVCNDIDVCTGNDAAGDTDGDGTCDDLDPCPLDEPDDSDNDGVCDSSDICLGNDATGDTDGDGVCADLDPCPLDNPDDSDTDGICDTDDICFGNNGTGDSDLDGICDSDDICFGNDATGDTDNDSICDDLDAASGDVDDNGNIDLADAILALQVTAAIATVSEVNHFADVNGDDAIGLAEALYDLQILADLR